MRQMVINKIPDPKDIAAREWLAEQINVVEQLKHLLTYPYVRQKFCEGKINLIGWHYIIETGEIFGYNREQGILSLSMPPSDI